MNIYTVIRNSFHKGYDEARGFVVIARTEEEAIGLTNDKWGDWPLNTKEVDVVQIGRGAGPQRVILRDFLAG